MAGELHNASYRREGPPGAADPAELAELVQAAATAAIVAYAAQHRDLMLADIMRAAELMAANVAGELEELRALFAIDG